MSRVKLALICIGLICVGSFSACSLLSSTTTKKVAPDELFFVYKDNPDTMVDSQGFMDKTGKIVVGPWETFEWNGKKYGGDSVKTNSNFRVLPFIEGMAGICFWEESQAIMGYGKCGFIDKTGKIVIEPKYKKISFFSDGLAAVSEDGISFGFIDKTGKQIIEAKFSGGLF